MNSSEIKTEPMRVAVVHWLPLEQYPPTQNILNYLSQQNNTSIICCTTNRRQEIYRYNNREVPIYLSRFPERFINPVLRIFLILWFPIWCFFRLLCFRPSHILYIEPHSAPAVFLYLIFAPNSKLLVHYHEYREISHFRKRGNLIARLGYWLERLWLHRKAIWISHTNEQRIELFLQDNPSVSKEKAHALPNLPPRSWVETAKKIKSDNKMTRLVYVGAASLHDTYLGPLIEWFKYVHTEGVSLDLYINTTDKATRLFLDTLNIPGLIVNSSGIPYQDLPATLTHYDIGLILYRCNSLNYIHNAPNKLFEYLACGLDVIYPEQMLGVHPYSRSNARPWVKSFNFDNMQNLKLDSFYSDSLPVYPWEKTCESVYTDLFDCICEKKLK